MRGRPGCKRLLETCNKFRSSLPSILDIRRSSVRLHDDGLHLGRRQNHFRETKTNHKPRIQVGHDADELLCKGCWHPPDLAQPGLSEILTVEVKNPKRVLKGNLVGESSRESAD